MSDYNQDEIRPYMARLPESRLRKLPPENGQKYKERFSSDKVKDNSKPYGNDEQRTSELLSLYGVAPDEYIRMKRDRESKHSQWSESDVNQVVSHYLKAVTDSENPVEPQPSVICQCCASINEYNRRQKKYMPATSRAGAEEVNNVDKPGSRALSTEEETAKRSPNPNEAKDVGFLGMGDDLPVEQAIPFFRSEHEGPDWISVQGSVNQPSNVVTPVNHIKQRREVYNHKDLLPDDKSVYVTHPVKKSLYSNWGVGEEIDGYNKDRHAVEDIVEASAHFVDNMEKLKKYRDYKY